jgi:hypothetical protein
MGGTRKDRVVRLGACAACVCPDMARLARANALIRLGPVFGHLLQAIDDVVGVGVYPVSGEVAVGVVGDRGDSWRIGVVLLGQRRQPVVGVIGVNPESRSDMIRADVVERVVRREAGLVQRIDILQPTSLPPSQSLGCARHADECNGSAASLADHGKRCCRSTPCLLVGTRSRRRIRRLNYLRPISWTSGAPKAKTSPPPRGSSPGSRLFPKKTVRKLRQSLPFGQAPE